LREESYRNFLFLIFLVLAAGSLIYLERSRISKPEEKKSAPQKIEKKIEFEEKFPEKKEIPEKKKEKKEKGKIKLAVVIDDFGTSQEVVYMMENLPREITPSILPFRQYSRWSAKYLKKQGFDVLLHLPMEPKNHFFREDNMLTVNMTRAQMERYLQRALREVPGASGINNHEGSKFTADPIAIKNLLFLLTNRNMFFLDSRTTRDTLAYETARTLGIKTCKRDVFLDNDHNINYIKGQWRSFLKKARKRGFAIAIGHARAETITALKILLKELPPQYTLVRVKKLAK